MPFFALWAYKVAGIPIEFIGLLLACCAGGELLATPFVGGIADRVGRRPVLLDIDLRCRLRLHSPLYLVHGRVRYGGGGADRDRRIRKRAASDRLDGDC